MNEANVNSKKPHRACAAKLIGKSKKTIDSTPVVKKVSATEFVCAEKAVISGNEWWALCTAAYNVSLPILTDVMCKVRWEMYCVKSKQKAHIATSLKKR